jgi:hypothetical protein
MPRAYRNPNPKHPAVEYLVRLHGDLGGRIRANQKEAKVLADGMRNVEAVIRLFDPAYDMRGITARRRHRISPWYRHGTMFRSVLDVLKTATESLTTGQIAERMLVTKGYAEPDSKDVRELETGVRSCLKRRLAKDVIADAGRPARWRLIARD